MASIYLIIGTKLGQLNYCIKEYPLYVFPGPFLVHEMTVYEYGVGDEMIQNRNVNDDGGLTLVFNPGGRLGQESS